MHIAWSHLQCFFTCKFSKIYKEILSYATIYNIVVSPPKMPNMVTIRQKLVTAAFFFLKNILGPEKHAFPMSTICSFKCCIQCMT